jgi:hypothetical protein
MDRTIRSSLAALHTANQSLFVSVVVPVECVEDEVIVVVDTYHRPGHVVSAFLFRQDIVVITTGRRLRYRHRHQWAPLLD